MREDQRETSQGEAASAPVEFFEGQTAGILFVNFMDGAPQQLPPLKMSARSVQPHSLRPLHSNGIAHLRVLSVVGIHLDLMAKRLDGDLRLLGRHF